MFKSKRHPLIFPQSEHQRLAGIIAQLWGNDSFEKPDLPFESFVTGVALHDHAYGLIDTLSIGDMSVEERRRSFEQLVESQLEDKIAEAVMKHHVLRLLNASNAYGDLKEKCVQHIRRLVADTKIPLETYQAADRITDVCDSIAFDFCFEKPAINSMLVDQKLNQTGQRLSYEMTAERTVILDPWPLSVASYQGHILAYEADSYPEKLRPVLITYWLESR